jgi:hypothetical protein
MLGTNFLEERGNQLASLVAHSILTRMLLLHVAQDFVEVTLLLHDLYMLSNKAIKDKYFGSLVVLCHGHFEQSCDFLQVLVDFVLREDN